MADRWPGRAVQIDRLVRVLGPPAAPVPPVFVGGLPSSGKTAVVRDLFQVPARDVCSARMGRGRRIRRVRLAALVGRGAPAERRARGCAGARLTAPVVSRRHALRRHCSSRMPM